ncbi:MAG: ferric reductase-like transmembrane domain-containing protein [Phycisphaerae bacterium]|nr:ferric reductase-like transmembrane domain-containing protein [Phycisphaerae bacterium]
MIKTNKKCYLFSMSLTFIGLPLLLWSLNDLPQRTALKDSISVLTIIAFSLMLGQFFLARTSKNILKDYNLTKALKIHKLIGYIFVPILLAHPFLIIFPRYFEAGIEPKEAFITLITTFESPGVILGIIAWCLMFILGVTSLLRNKLPIKYKTWRVIHGILSIMFILIATRHAIMLGRHMDRAMSICMSIMAAGGILLLLKTYILKSSKIEGGTNE